MNHVAATLAAIATGIQPPPSPPWLATIQEDIDGTSVTLCYRDRPSEPLSLTAYHARFGVGHRPRERWYLIEGQP